MRIAGSVALITGASRGIGRETAQALHANGATVGLIARSEADLDTAAAALGTRVATATADVGDRDQVDDAISILADRLGRPDILVNNAGIGVYASMLEEDPTVFEHLMRVNYFGTVYATLAVLPGMADRRKGHIVNVASVAGRLGAPFEAAYSASKFAVVGLSESLAAEVQSLGIRVSLVNPGPVKTHFTEARGVPFQRNVPRPLSPERIAGAVVAAVEHDRFEQTIPRWLRMGSVARAIAPNLYRRGLLRDFGTRGRVVGTTVGLGWGRVGTGAPAVTMSPSGRSTSNATVFSGGRILTMEAAFPDAEAVVVREGRIAAVGSAEVARKHPDAEIVDLAGRTLAPGFIDAHCHLSIAALQPRWGDCSHASTVGELAEVLRAHCVAEPDAEWARADRWDERTGLVFDRRDLDAITGDRPAIVVHHTYHQCVVNSAGLDRLGIGRLAAADDDLITVDAEGEPTGVLLERASGRAHSASMASYTDPDRWAEHIATRARFLITLGITAVHDAACDPAAETVYRLMARQGLLPLSVLVMPHPATFLTNDLGDRLDGAPTGEGDEWFRVGALKFFADGGVAPAIDVHFGGERLAFGYRHPDLAPRLVEAVERGFRVGVHAMGNQGVTDTLDAFAAAARRRPSHDHRFRLEHAGMASPALARRAVELGAVGVVQPGFVDHVGDSAGDFQPDDATWLPFATLAEAGVLLAGSSDDPCGPCAPLACAHFGVTRRTSGGRIFGPSESLPFEDWLRFYTIGGAYAGGQEDERGSLTPGKRADLVLLDGPWAAGEVPRVAETWVAGHRAYQRDPDQVG